MTGSGQALNLNNLTDFTIGAAGSGATIELPTDGSLNGMGRPIEMAAINNVVVDGLDLSWSGAGRGGFGVLASSGTNMTFSHLNASNRNIGLYAADGARDVVMTNNNLSNTDTAILLRSVFDSPDADALPFVVHDNQMTGSGQALNLNNLTDFTIGAAGSGATIELPTDGSLNAMGRPIEMAAISNVVVDGLDLSWSGPTRNGFGLQASSGTNMRVSNVIAGNRGIGLYVADGARDVTLTHNNLVGSDTGIYLRSVSDADDADDVGAVVTDSLFSANITSVTVVNSTARLTNNAFLASATAVDNSSAEINAENNYWNASDGPSTLGGSGTRYVGAVDADPFLTSAPTNLLLKRGAISAPFITAISTDNG